LGFHGGCKAGEEEYKGTAAPRYHRKRGDVQGGRSNEAHDRKRLLSKFTHAVRPLSGKMIRDAGMTRRLNVRPKI
jgi:hypothetical protein